jgi:hypothetical protein
MLQKPSGGHTGSASRHRQVHPYEVSISSGRIRGEYISLSDEQSPYEFTVFKGIPYARPPLGIFRFQA